MATGPVDLIYQYGCGPQNAGRESDPGDRVDVAIDPVMSVGETPDRRKLRQPSLNTVHGKFRRRNRPKGRRGCSE
jgi:hypothetical protein